MNLFGDYLAFLARGDVPVEVVPIIAICVFGGALIVRIIMRSIVELNAKKYERMQGATGGKGAPGPGGASGSEAAAIRQMQQTLIKMEERVEALETILIEHTRSQKI